MSSPDIWGTGTNPGGILAIAAHPEDGMFTMGAAVAQHIANGGTRIFLSLSLALALVTTEGQRVLKLKKF